MIKVRVLVERQYENVQDFMKNENFGFRFHKFGKEELIFSVFNLDPVSRNIDNLGFFKISHTEFNTAFESDEKILREYVAVNSHLVKKEE